MPRYDSMRKTKVTKEKMIEMKLNGDTYSQIAKKLKISRQRVQQITSPPKEVRDYIIQKYNGRCARCDIQVHKTGHIHHVGSIDENYNDIDNLILLCPSCHCKEHKGESQKRRENGCVMPTYDSLRKVGRDNKIRQYAKKHPDYSHQEIADHFGISRSNATRILNQGGQDENPACV